MREVVVTGMGLVTPFGVGRQAAWQGLREGRSVVSRLDTDWSEDCPVKIAARVPEGDAANAFDPEEAAPAKDRRKMDRFIQFALVAAKEAVRQAGLSNLSDAMKLRAGTAIASGIGGFPAIMEAERSRMQGKRVSPFLIPSFLANLAAGQVSIRYGLKGPLHTPVTACAAGAQAIGGAARLIAHGEADCMVAGGSEACIDWLSLSGFAAAKAICTKFTDAPEQASRPFDRDRAGFVMGEGAGIVVLESREQAEARGATILARLAGYGETADAYHMTAPSEDGDGGARAMQAALTQSGLSAADIGYLNAHSTSTGVGDKAELNGVQTVFGRARELAISSTKSMTGHLLGAAGAVEAVFSLLALRHGFLPPTANLDNPDEEFDYLDLVPKTGREKDLGAVMSNAFGFGGVNASLIFTKA